MNSRHTAALALLVVAVLSSVYACRSTRRAADPGTYAVIGNRPQRVPSSLKLARQLDVYWLKYLGRWANMGLTIVDKHTLSERDICTKFITPALRRAGGCKRQKEQKHNPPRNGIGNRTALSSRREGCGPACA
jgi:hypothetical protein